MTDYRKIRFNNLCSEEFRHVWLLLFWPAFGIVFALLERGGVTANFHAVRCALDDMIPFCEYFLVFYLYWFIFLPFMLAYTFLFDVPAFKRMMYFIMSTYLVTVTVYFIYPTAQYLRPESFARDNVFTRFLTWFYSYDTCTNVCPSIHVIGSFAAMNAAWDTPRFKTPGWRWFFALSAVMISVSTLFVKQHSVLDVLWALPLCAAAALFVYRPWKSLKFKEKTTSASS